MPFVHGRRCDLFVGAERLQGFYKSADLSVDVDSAETSVFGLTYKTFLTGQGSAKVELSGLYDVTLTSRHTALFASPEVATIGPGGLVLADRAWLLSAHTVNYAESAAVGDAVMTSLSLMSDARVGFGYAMSTAGAAAVGTGTTNGTGVDNTTVTLANPQWVLDVHVTAVSGTSPTLVVKIQDSADNVSFADVAGITTATLTGTGATRVTGTTATLRRYWRVVHTVAGTTPSFTVFSAFSAQLT